MTQYGAQFHADEQQRFFHWFHRGFEDIFFYGYGFADQSKNPGYEDGIALGVKEIKLNDEQVQNVAEMLWDARQKTEKENSK